MEQNPKEKKSGFFPQKSRLIIQQFPFFPRDRNSQQHSELMNCSPSWDWVIPTVPGIINNSREFCLIQGFGLRENPNPPKSDGKRPWVCLGWGLAASSGDWGSFRGFRVLFTPFLVNFRVFGVNFKGSGPFLKLWGQCQRFWVILRGFGVTLRDFRTPFKGFWVPSEGL